MTEPLLDSRVIDQFLTREAPWHESHGAGNGYLGMGLLYYAVTYALRADVAVCLGSGGGFVPRLMRQAQRDLGIAGEARTILVDGDVGEAGWGRPQWLDEASFFRQSYPDVEIVLQRTAEAAETLFAAKGIRIRYLHIDADHSLEGAFEDFLCYRPFLDVGSVVTLHDTSFPGAGVKYVVEHIRRRPDCELVDFVDMGAGTALARISADGDRPSRRVPPDRRSAVSVTRKPDAPALDPPTTEWRYLRSEAFSARQVLAAHFLRDCPTVVELGGWHSSVDRYLTGAHQSVLVVDPFLRDSTRNRLNGSRCRVRHVGARFQDLSWTISRPHEYGLVILGLDLDLADADERLLFDLVDQAKVTVIEFPTSWEPSRRQYSQIRANTSVEEVLRLGLDLDGNDFGDLTNSWPPRVEREIHVLAPAGDAAPRRPRAAAGTVPPASPDEQWRRLLAGDAAARASWEAHGGEWSFDASGARVRNRTGAEEWVTLERSAPVHRPGDGKRAVVEVSVSGSAEAAGISFGAYRDFLVEPGSRPRLVQVEIDPLARLWAHRVDGRLCPRAWWNDGVTCVDDLLQGRLALKARNADDVSFGDLTVREVDVACRISVVLTCNRFLQRLRLALRNWCHQDLPVGSLELLVVNPDSPDGTAEHLAVVARDAQHVAVREVRVPAELATNKGAMINSALELARGEWIWITDADCLFPPGAAHAALLRVEEEPKHLYYLRRRHLTEPQTDALLAGTLDSVRDFDELAAASDGRGADDNYPWGYTQLFPRAALELVRYPMGVNHFAHTDGTFVEECRRNGYPARPLAGMLCLHLTHPFAWYGTDSFL
jgi:hypothetical protein